ncbi:CDT phosphatase transcription factor [Dasineura jujubifolia toursvirus 2a]|nr:CDT phosphatase transcription factor [Dasineura jujubifolia toursvirus 2a]
MSERKNIFLDLDNTIIFSELCTPDVMKSATKFHYEFISPYVTIARPHLQQFLDYLFENYNVCIWTAASKPYALMIYQKFIKKFGVDRQIQLLLFNDHCEISKRETGHTKSLKMLWEYWKIPGYTKENTYIIDDLKEVYDTQPNNCFPIKEFKMQNGENDKELLKMINTLEEHKWSTPKTTNNTSFIDSKDVVTKNGDNKLTKLTTEQNNPKQS